MGELGVTPRTIDDKQAQSIGRLARRVGILWKTAGRAGREDGINARVLVRPGENDDNAVVVKSSQAAWGSGAYGTGQAFMLLRDDYSGTPVGGGTTTEPDRNVVFRVDRNGGIGSAGGIHVATGMRLNGRTQPTQGIWVQNVVDAVGVVITGLSTGQNSDLFQAIQGQGFAAWRIGPNGVPLVRASSSADQSIANGTPTALVFGAEQYDSDSMHTAGGSTLTAPGTGWTGRVFRMVGNARFAANATGARQLYIQTNGGVIVASVTVNATTGGAVTDLSVAGDYILNAGDSVALVATQTSGGNLNVLSGSTTNFSMSYVGG